MIRPEFVTAARQIMELPPDVRAELAERLVTASNPFLVGLGATAQNTPLPGDGELAVQLLAIEIAGCIRRSYLDGHVASGLAIVPESGELWTALRAACSEEVMLAELADIDAMLDGVDA